MSTGTAPKRAKAAAGHPRVATTLDVNCYPTVGVDTGERWCGICVRIGLDVVDATTVDLPPADGPGADRVRVERLLARVDEVMTRHEADAVVGAQLRGVRLDVGQSPWRLAVEAVHRPSAYLRGQRVPPRQQVYWSTAQAMALYYAVLATFPDAVVVQPDHHGKRHQPRETGGSSGLWQDYYPAPLHRVRPHDFTASDSQDRDHERAAYDVAGAANLPEADR